MNKHSLERRLAVLAKARLLQLAPPPSPEEMLCMQKVQELLEGMNPVYANRVAEELVRPLHECSDFALEVLGTAMDHVTENRPLALPDVVAEVYLLGSQCRLCRYRLPSMHFHRCPLCGGEVGY
jgi:hypothetical protein